MTILQYEQYLIDTIYPELELGRPGWDLPHTQMVVSYIKKIINSNADMHLDRAVLVITAYLHDFGYQYYRDEIQAGPTVGIAKEMHAIKSAEKWTEVQEMAEFDFLTVEQKTRIHHLITIHDMPEHWNENDECVVMEADTLGALAMEPNIDPQSDKYQSYLGFVRSKRAPCFVTQYGKAELEYLLSRHDLS